MYDPEKVHYLKTPAYHPTMAVHPVAGGYRVLNHLQRVVVPDLEEGDIQDPRDLDPWVVPGSCWAHIGTVDEAERRLFLLFRVYEEEVHAYPFDWGRYDWANTPGLMVGLERATYKGGEFIPFSMTPLTKAEFLRNHVRLWAPDNRLEGPGHPLEGSVYKVQTLDRGPNTQYISRYQARTTIYDMLLE